MNKFLEEEKWNYYPLVIPIVLFFTLFILWASFSQIDEVVRGEGKVIPSGQTKVLQHFEGGIISEILVSPGDHVKKGDILYRLENEYFDADLNSKAIELMAYEAKALRLQALINEKNVLVYSDTFRRLLPSIIQNEMHIFREEKSKYKNKIAIAQDQLRQKEYKLDELESKFQNLSIELQLATENMSIQEDLLKKKVTSRKNYIVELAKKQRIYTQIEEVRSAIPIVKEEIKEWQRKVKTVESDEKSKLYDQYSLIQVEIKKLQEKNKANKDRDTRKEVVSPVNGVINMLYFHTINGIVKAGDKMAEITPLEDNLMIEAKIKTSDRALIWVGQDVSIEITSYDFSKYGLLKGKLIGIAPDSTMDKMGNTYYLVKIQANDYQFDNDSPIMMGMIANINILTTKRTVMHYLLKPLKDITKNSLGEH
ncbi:HlyD family type I secretion periplasmic adaptor subunit [Arcobacter sp. 15-2]|uniref:HlyD family type I secretion periplasmic adaptor subunit n=1 Tax=Arcobacter sp. 15-2 TaxID=3374109 RepID=UPI00399CEBC9